MNEQEYIRKAVELADGWTFDELSVRVEGFCQFAHYDYYLDQQLLDALAAQLVRQVDTALKDWRCLELFEGHTTVRKFEPFSETGKDIAACYGKGRTMNTIKAIVDAGVLQQQET